MKSWGIVEDAHECDMKTEEEMMATTRSDEEEDESADRECCVSGVLSLQRQVWIFVSWKWTLPTHPFRLWISHVEFLRSLGSEEEKQQVHRGISA